MKHSGQVKETICKWKYEDMDVLEMLMNFANKLEKKDDELWFQKALFTGWLKSLSD